MVNITLQRLSYLPQRKGQTEIYLIRTKDYEVIKLKNVGCISHKTIKTWNDCKI